MNGDEGARAVLDAYSGRTLSAIDDVKRTLRSGMTQGVIEDLAFIGNSSSVYAWSPCLMVDLDAFLFARELDLPLGTWLGDVRDALSSRLAEFDIAFDVKIVEGPYKPPVAGIERPIIVAHLGVFTEPLYRRSPALKRWAWRKYACEVEAGRLRRLAPPQPDLLELLEGRKGVRERVRSLLVGAVAMHELTIPRLLERTFHVTADDAGFQECCFAYAANCARNHCRALGCVEADSLGNSEFFAWYDRNVFASSTLLRLMAMKARSRNHGFIHSTEEVRQLALHYMRSLQETLEKQAG